MKFDRQLNRQVPRLFSPENAIHKRGRATIGVHVVRPVGKQTAFSDEDRYLIDRRDVVSRRQRYNCLAMAVHKIVRHRDEAASRLARK